MKKYIAVGAVVVAFGVYLLLNRQQSTYVASVTTAAPMEGAATDTHATSSASSGTVALGAAGTTAGAYKDGSYKGSVADAYYGSLQVEAVIQGGKLADVEYPTYPNAAGHTSEVSATDLPILKQEAIVSQSANVNIVSGATQTSEAFQQSLGAALALAK